MEAVTTQDGLRAGSQQLPPKPQCWEHLLGARRLLPGPPHLSQAPRLLPLHPVAMGTSTLQLTEQLARCLFFSFYLGLIFAFISWAPSLPSPDSVHLFGQTHLFGMKWRLRPPEPSDATTFLQPPRQGSASKLHPVPSTRAGSWTSFLMGEKNPCVSG